MFNARTDWSASNEARTEYRTFSVETLTPHIGAVVRDVDLAQPLSDERAQDIHDAWLDWKVLLFRDQRIDREQHKAFARRFGSLHVHPMQHIRGGDPEILVVKTTRNSPYTAGDGWHTDVTCDEIPPLGSMLYLTEMPESGGGDTLFADMYLAFEMLSEPMQAFLEGLTAVHDGAGPYVGSYKSTPPEGGYPRSEHPVVVRHPGTGRKVLFVNRGFTSHIVGLNAPESRALLNMLYRHIDSTPRLWCRVEWAANTLAFWDNRCTQHHAIWDYYPHSRYGERVSIYGNERPVA
ncbi:MAG: TauD/TfdA family dioxygenase [Gammaproteobacteria bacterium]|nr:TauD/TfdA family dioxygenase [Gammaproteobacteria bacterium]MDE0364094.1 TauD/TfdA family dioxygenase [Gammaproteobacteria bacterium]